MAIYNPRAELLWWSQTAPGVGSTLSVAGTYHSADVDLRDACDVWLAVYVAGTATGTTPTLDVWLDLKEASGGYLLQALHATQLTTAPAYSSISGGIHIAGVGSMTLPERGRITWTLGGTNPVYPQASIALYGR
jgi:hypothetical protein